MNAMNLWQISRNVIFGVKIESLNILESLEKDGAFFTSAYSKKIRPMEHWPI
jgi:hypothetical protein